MSYCNLTSQLRRLDGYPMAFFPIEAYLLPPNIGAMPSTLVMDPTVKSLSDAQGQLTVRLPKGAKVLVRFPSFRPFQRIICVPDEDDADLLDYLFPYPVELEWNLCDDDGEEADPSLLAVGETYHLGHLALMSNQTKRVVPQPRVLFDTVTPVAATPTMWTLREDAPVTGTAESDEGFVGTESTLWKRLGLTTVDYAYFLTPADFEVVLPPPLVLEFA